MRSAVALACLLGASIVACTGPLRAEDGYRLWLRYEPVADAALRASYAERLTRVVTEGASETIAAARDELVAGLSGLLERPTPAGDRFDGPGGVLLGTPAGSPLVAGLGLEGRLAELGDEGYLVTQAEVAGSARVVVAANTDRGALYGAFALLRRLQTAQPLEGWEETSRPRVTHRVLNHWDNLNGFIERGYAGRSLWDWFDLPDYIDPRLTDYARACASIGLNGSCLTNVNANASILRPEYLAKVAAIADTFRPYGVRVYLTARFSAPVELGGLPTADPLDEAVRAWWAAKANEVYRHVPDFGGFVVKANSEGQPGPQDYGRTHQDGANTIADAVAPHGGVVMWRAFVYQATDGVDRATQAYNEFKPLDGGFRPNVMVQVKNGPIDFMPREPFHPLFGAMPQTPLAAELQITQEYLGSATHLAYLAPMWKEVLDADTHTAGPGSTVARVVDGGLDGHAVSGMVGVANTGSDRNWTGHPLAQANWHAFGRLAWDHTLTSRQLATEWARMTLSNDPEVTTPVVDMLLASREAVVDYMTPLGLHHIMARGHHYGPGPWVAGGRRADWTSVYYHRADEQGIGFDRSATGSNAVAQYAPPVAARYGSVETCPENLLLFFHHAPWDHRLRSGHTLWDALALRYQAGVDAVRGWVDAWEALEGRIDPQRHDHVLRLLKRQEREARWWRDACLLYFQSISKRPLPAGVEPPEHDLGYYRAFELLNPPGHPGSQ